MPRQKPTSRPSTFIERTAFGVSSTNLGAPPDADAAGRDKARSRCFLGVVFVLIVFFLVDFGTTKYSISALEAITDWLQEVDLSVCLIMLISFGILSPPLGAPFSIYPLIVSFVMGVRTGSKTEAVIWGSALTAIFLPIGGWLGFLLSRHVLMDWATRLSAKFPTLEALHSVFSQPSQSLKIMILLRLSPVLPSSILNYILGTFPVRNREFLLSYFFSAVFWGIPLSMVGSVFTNMSDMEEGNDTTDPSTPIGLTIIVLGVGATVGVTLAITHYTRKKLREIIKAEEAKAEEANADGETTGVAGGGAKVSAITTISEEEVGVELT